MPERTPLRTSPRPEPEPETVESTSSARATRVADDSPTADADTALLAEIQALLASDQLRVRFEGIRRLASTRPTEAVPEILRFLEDSREEPHLLQRLAAVRLLGTLEGVSTADELHGLYEAGDPAMRRVVATSLEAQGDATLVDRELAGLRGALADPDGGLRAEAVQAAGELASPRAVPVLLPLLSDPNSEVRARAIDGLWRVGDPTLIPTLEPLRTDPVGRVRERAERAIAALRADLERGASARR